MIDQQLRDEAVNLVFAGYELNMRWLIICAIERAR
jgi:hypothetical protein